MKELENTILAMAEWLDEHTDGYLSIVTKGGESMCVVKSRDEKLLLESLVSGMVNEPILKGLMARALGIVMALDIENKSKQDKKDDTPI